MPTFTTGNGLQRHTFDAHREAYDVTAYGDVTPRHVAGPTFYVVDGCPLTRDLFFALADYFGVLDKPKPEPAAITETLQARGIILPED